MTTVQNYKNLAGTDLSTLDDAGNLVLAGGVTDVNTASRFGAGIKGSQVSLTSVQLLALRATPVSLIAAPGAGKYVRVLSVDLHYTFVTGAYTNTNAALKLFYGTTASAKPLTGDQTALLTQVANAHNLNIVLTANVNLTDALGLNVAIFLGNDGSAEFLTGAGTLEVVTSYAIVTP